MSGQDKKKTLSLGGGKLSLGSGAAGGAASARSGSSRSNARPVQVEVVRNRTAGRRSAAASPTPKAAPSGAGATDTSSLTQEERVARNRALIEGFKPKSPPPVSTSKAKPEPETPSAENDHSAGQAMSRRERELMELQKIAEAEEARRAEEAKRNPSPAQKFSKAADTANVADTADDKTGGFSRPAARKKEQPEAPKRTMAKRGQEQERRRGKITISEALDGEARNRQRSLASVRRAREKEKARLREAQQQPNVKQSRDVIIPDAITVQELSNRMAERAADVVKELMKLGIMATVTQTIDAETAELIVLEFGHKPNRVSEADIDITGDEDEDDPATLRPRPPVVTIMGHVDHGKTSLLDAIRSTDVALGESGGITQHIGAYQVRTAADNRITFIDTPGHEAFTEMRMRGATITDIVILVVAADDGVMEQTIEAISHAKAAGCPVIIAVNKCDKPEADPQRVRNELLKHEIVTEDFGGDVLCVDVSAHTKAGLDKLEEAIMLQAELLELKANPDRAAEAAVIEAKVERGRGSVASVLILKGTLEIGQVFVVGAETGRVRAMVDDRGNNIEIAKPGDAVEVLGLNGTPMAGDRLSVVENEARAREVSEYRQRVLRQKEATAGARGTVEQMLSAIASGEAMELPLVIKTDVHGSLEAIKAALNKISTDQVQARILSSGVGAISESDISLAAASSGIVLAFNVRANPQARMQAKRDAVEIRYHSIIYELIDDVKAAMSGLLSPDRQENFIGYAEILEVFNITKVGKIAGCKVTEGVIKRGCKVRLLRDNVVVHEGSLKTLKRFKDEVKEVREGQECGMAFENYSDLEAGDMIECFEIEEVARTL
ncbi:MAG: translation initiation factor IF-2 [Alphaproteobacteria bacterium]|nr:translation initiation factor IF-2 [Alphaproteobacteria bacterium]